MSSLPINMFSFIAHGSHIQVLEPIELKEKVMHEIEKMGVMRIKKNLSLDTDNVVEWCKAKIKSENVSV